MGKSIYYKKEIEGKKATDRSAQEMAAYSRLKDGTYEKDMLELESSVEDANRAGDFFYDSEGRGDSSRINLIVGDALFTGKSGEQVRASNMTAAKGVALDLVSAGLVGEVTNNVTRIFPMPTSGQSLGRFVIAPTELATMVQAPIDFMMIEHSESGDVVQAFSSRFPDLTLSDGRKLRASGINMLGIGNIVLLSPKILDDNQTDKPGGEPILAAGFDNSGMYGVRKPDSNKKEEEAESVSPEPTEEVSEKAESAEPILLFTIGEDSEEEGEDEQEENIFGKAVDEAKDFAVEQGKRLIKAALKNYPILSALFEFLFPDEDDEDDEDDEEQEAVDEEEQNREEGPKSDLENIEDECEDMLEELEEFIENLGITKDYFKEVLTGGKPKTLSPNEEEKEESGEGGITLLRIDLVPLIAVEVSLKAEYKFSPHYQLAHSIKAYLIDDIIKLEMPFAITAGVSGSISMGLGADLVFGASFFAALRGGISAGAELEGNTDLEVNTGESKDKLLAGIGLESEAGAEFDLATGSFVINLPEKADFKLSAGLLLSAMIKLALNFESVLFEMKKELYEKELCKWEIAGLTIGADGEVNLRNFEPFELDSYKINQTYVTTQLFNDIRTEKSGRYGIGIPTGLNELAKNMEEMIQIEKALQEMGEGMGGPLSTGTGSQDDATEGVTEAEKEEKDRSNNAWLLIYRDKLAGYAEFFKKTKSESLDRTLSDQRRFIRKYNAKSKNLDVIAEKSKDKKNLTKEDIASRENIAKSATGFSTFYKEKLYERALPREKMIEIIAAFRDSELQASTDVQGKLEKLLEAEELGGDASNSALTPEEKKNVEKYFKDRMPIEYVETELLEYEKRRRDYYKEKVMELEILEKIDKPKDAQKPDEAEETAEGVTGGENSKDNQEGSDKAQKIVEEIVEKTTITSGKQSEYLNNLQSKYMYFDESYRDDYIKALKARYIDFSDRKKRNVIRHIQRYAVLKAYQKEWEATDVKFKGTLRDMAFAYYSPETIEKEGLLHTLQQLNKGFIDDQKQKLESPEPWICSKEEILLGNLESAGAKRATKKGGTIEKNPLDYMSTGKMKNILKFLGESTSFLEEKRKTTIEQMRGMEDNELLFDLLPVGFLLEQERLESALFSGSGRDIIGEIYNTFNLKMFKDDIENSESENFVEYLTKISANEIKMPELDIYDSRRNGYIKKMMDEKKKLPHDARTADIVSKLAAGEGATSDIKEQYLKLVEKQEGTLKDIITTAKSNLGDSLNNPVGDLLRDDDKVLYKGKLMAFKEYYMKDLNDIIDFIGKNEGKKSNHEMISELRRNYDVNSIFVDFFKELPEEEKKTLEDSDIGKNTIEQLLMYEQNRYIQLIGSSKYAKLHRLQDMVDNEKAPMYKLYIEFGKEESFKEAIEAVNGTDGPIVHEADVHINYAKYRLEYRNPENYKSYKTHDARVKAIEKWKKEPGVSSEEIWRRYRRMVKGDPGIVSIVKGFYKTGFEDEMIKKVLGGSDLIKKYSELIEFEKIRREELNKEHGDNIKIIENHEENTYGKALDLFKTKYKDKLKNYIKSFGKGTSNPFDIGKDSESVNFDFRTEMLQEYISQRITEVGAEKAELEKIQNEHVKKMTEINAKLNQLMKDIKDAETERIAKKEKEIEEVRENIDLSRIVSVGSS